MIGSNPYGIFVNTNNTVYVANQASSQILIWFEGNINAKTISSGLSNPYALFVTSTGDIYADNGFANGQVTKRTMNVSTSIPVMYVGQKCYDLFVDKNDTLYCSMYNLHEVVTKSLSSSSNALKIVAGTGCSGSASNMLYNPRGIFVDINFDLYVADCGNDRIQFFSSGQLTGLTVAGSGAPTTITLDCPTDVILDADNYLFIVDQYNHRIIGSGPNGFRCLVGCSGGGSGSNQLLYPQSMAFDEFKNLY
jgi:hypothetical protein